MYRNGLLSFSTILFLSACNSGLHNPEIVQRKVKNQFRVVTYNLNWGEGEFTVTSPKDTMFALEHMNADLVLLQEVTSFWYRNINANLSKIYPYRAYKADGDAGGLAALSKYPIIDLHYKKAKICWHQAMLFSVKSPMGTVQVANLHLTPPLASKKNLSFSPIVYFTSPKIRKNEAEYYYQQLKNNSPTIIAGDFNEGDNGFVRQFLIQKGYTDALKPNQCSWQWKMGLITLRRKLDHIFYNHQLKQTHAQIVHDGDSDHFPTLVDLIRT